MKTIIVAMGIVLFAAPPALAHHKGPVTFGVFQQSLSPYGQWVRWNGIAVWQPCNIGPSWQPYTIGHWAWTSDGWYWVSDEPWGWATYHYGRWHFDEYYGWVWLPDYEWAPAWVDWRSGGDYIGWAPMGPRAGFHVTVYLGPPRWHRQPHHWSFVLYSKMTTPNVRKHFIPKHKSRSYIGQTRSIEGNRYRNGRLVKGGPELTEVERRGQIRVARVERKELEKRQEGVDRRPGSVRPYGTRDQGVEQRSGRDNRPSPRVDSQEKRNGGKREKPDRLSRKREEVDR